MNNEKSNTRHKKSHNKRMIIVLVFLLVMIMFNLITLRGEYLEIFEVGENYTQVFWQKITYKFVIVIINFLVLFASIFITNKVIKKGLKPFFEEDKIDMPKLPNKSLAFIISGAISLLIPNYLLEKVMLSLNSSWFGINDPIFNVDIGVYLFQYPFIKMMIGYFIILVLGLTLYSILYYIITFNKCFDGVSRETLKNSRLIKQLSTGIIIILILIGLFIIINTQNIGNDTFLTLNDQYKTELVGAGLIDTTIKLWGYRLLAIILVISVFLAIKAFKKGNLKKLLISLVTVPTYLISLFIIMILFDLIFVNPSEFDKEKKYIGYNIEYTKNAYGINIEEKDIEYSGTLTAEQSNEYEQIIQNVKIIDSDITIDALEEYQSNSNIYKYNDIYLNQYKINGKDELVYIAPREIINRTYDEKTYEYTHGYGIIITSATKVDEDNNIIYLQKDFENIENLINIEEPRIYYGIQNNSTVITSAKNKQEYDYPITATKWAEYSYEGKSGLDIGFWDRVVLGIYKGDLNLAFSSQITDNSKILTNRNIIERAKTVFPYLIYDENPYLIISDEGRLIWILDAYTTTNSYPYSQKINIEVNGEKRQINYIRNSVKVLIDAYDGTVEYYITDRTDPIIMAYWNIYPELFKDIEATLPESVINYIKYPQFLYNIQAKMLKTYHNVNIDVLYRTDDIWSFGTHATSKLVNTKGVELEPEYTAVKNENTGEMEIGLIIPYTLSEKQNIISYLVGINENGNNKLTMYKFSSDSNILGPMQLDTQLEQDETISAELESLNVTGTKLYRNIITVPIGNTILYVEPIYQIMLNESNIPTLKKVVVASGNKVAIGNNLKEAINNLLSQFAVDIEVENTDDEEGLIDAIIKANYNLTNSNNNNDWEMVGKDIQKLQELIKKLELLIEEKEKNTQTNEVTEDILEINTTNSL